LDACALSELTLTPRNLRGGMVMGRTG